MKRKCTNFSKNFSLTSVDRKIWDRERKWQDKLDTLEDELATSLTYTGKTIQIINIALQTQVKVS